MKRILKTLLFVILITAATYFVLPSAKNLQPDKTDKIRTQLARYDSCTTGIIIINTGTTASLTKRDVGLFIGDMLSDPYVMGMPEWACRTLACKIIVPMRPSSSLGKYSKIWGDSEFSPLLINTLALADSVENAIAMPVSVAMRYGAPSARHAILNLEERCPNLKNVILLPLFPHYAESSYLTAVDEIEKCAEFATGKYNLTVIRPYYNDSTYIASLANMIENATDKEHHLIFSFHSLPISHIEAGKAKGAEFDYEYQCRETSRLVSEKLGIEANDYSVVYASAMGRKWLGPTLDDAMTDLPGKGIRKVTVITPGFIIDNLETLYDIDLNARKAFIDSGGESFTFIPCLNAGFKTTAVGLIEGECSSR